MTTAEKRAESPPSCFADWIAQKEGAIAAATTDTARSTIRTEITATTDALNTKIDAAKGTVQSSTPAHLEDILYLERAVKKKEEEILIAKDRAAAVRGGGQPSYYESWFPLGRPIKPTLVPVLTAVALFLLLVAGMFAASLFGFTATVLYPAPRLSYATGPSLISRFFALFPPSFWILLVIAGAIIYYLFYVRPEQIAKAAAEAVKSA